MSLDLSTVFTIIGTSVTTASIFVGASVQMFKYYVRMEVKNALLVNNAELIVRMNGTYMRGEQQREINHQFAEDIRDLRSEIAQTRTEMTEETREVRDTLAKMHADMRNLTGSLSRFHVEDLKSERRAAGA